MALSASLETARRRFFYGGLSRNVYRQLRPEITRKNYTVLRSLSFLAAIYGILLSILSYLSLVNPNGLPAYLHLGISSAVFYLISISILPRYKRLVMPTFYAMLASVSLFGILLGTVRAPAPNRAATTFCVLLFAIPFLMIDVSFRADLLTICSTVTFCILSSQCKTPEAVSLDVTNSVCFCVLSCMSSWIFSCRSIGQLADQVFIEKERDTDGLTRLLTKSASKVLISTYLGQGTPGSLLIVDIDDFKSVNDRFGHLYGDEVLRRFAQCLHENVQRPDILGRFGGDEFIVFLIGADASDASATAWCITQAVASCFRGSRCPITCSIGTATVERSHQDYEELFQAADQALYNAKDCGKNQVKVNY